MRMDHVERGLPFGIVVGSGQVVLHDQARPVFHKRMAHEAEHSACAGGFS